MADANRDAQVAAQADKLRLQIEVRRQREADERERAELANRLRIQDAMNRRRP